MDMKSLKDSLRKSLAHRHMGHQMVGAVALNIVRDFLGVQKHTKSVESITSLDDSGEHDTFMEFNENQSGLEGHVRFKVLFLKTDDQALKIKIFQQKNQILREVNLALEKV
jgi:hypothetical protein